MFLTDTTTYIICLSVCLTVERPRLLRAFIVSTICLERDACIYRVTNNSCDYSMEMERFEKNLKASRVGFSEYTHIDVPRAKEVRKIKNWLRFTF